MSIKLDTEKEVLEARHLLGYYRQPGGWQVGGFTTNLIAAWEKADMGNRFKLAASFPELGKAVQISTTDGLSALADAVDEAVKRLGI